MSIKKRVVNSTAKMGKVKKNLIIVLIILLSVSYGLAQSLFINEFMADNQSFGEDPDGPGEFDDWIEIFNCSSEDILLDGFYLTNDFAQPTKWMIPENNSIPAGGFLVFVADNQEYQGNNHTNFILSKNGGEIAIIDSNMAIIDSHSYDTQTTDISQGRYPDGSIDWQFFDLPTPGRRNSLYPAVYYDQIYAAFSTDGINWNVDDKLIIDHGSVPGAVYFDSKIYLYFVNAANPENIKLSVGVSEDDGDTFNILDVEISGTNSPNPVDPNAIVDNDEIRLTYIGNLDEGSENNIVTATSSDGINFTEDGIIYSGDYYDPDLFYDADNSEWVLLLGKDNNITKTTSSAVSSYFSRDSSFSWNLGSISETHLVGAEYLTYYVGDFGISVTEYSQGYLTEPPLAEGIIDFNGRVNADPSVITAARANYIMYFKTESETGDEPVPVSLSSFNGNYSAGQILINWTTQSEYNCIGWNIFRSNYESFNTAVRINSQPISGAGTTTETQNYDFIDPGTFHPETSYYYWLEELDADGSTNVFGPLKITTTADDYQPEAPQIIDSQILNYPNPFSNHTIITFSLNNQKTGADNSVQIGIFNLKGQLIKELSTPKKTKTGKYQILWDGTDKYGKDAASGIYMFKLQEGEFSNMKKMILLR